jgi:hypothetical protein
VFLVDGEEYTCGNPNGNGKRKSKKPTSNILNNDCSNSSANTYISTQIPIAQPAYVLNNDFILPCHSQTPQQMLNYNDFYSSSYAGYHYQQQQQLQQTQSNSSIIRISKNIQQEQSNEEECTLSDADEDTTASPSD